MTRNGKRTHTSNTIKQGRNTEEKDLRLKKFNLLALLLNFEKYWSPYSLSDGSLYKKEVKAEANKVVDLYREIYENESSQELPIEEGAIKTVIYDAPRDIIDALDKWCGSDNLYPDYLKQNAMVGENRFDFQAKLIRFETDLAKDLKLPVGLSCSVTSTEEMFHKNVLKWAAQLPDEVISKVDNNYINKMSDADTLVVVGDIRHSQDLMTYGSSSDVYREKIIEFMNRTREILKNNCGIYDRFTGDGFIAYFNKFMCEEENKDYYEMMLKSCREIMNFATPFLEEWSKLLRRIPEKEIGLCIGVDSGTVSFKDLNNQLFAIGDACVWAKRMNAAGVKGEVIVNNIPYQVLSNNLNRDNCRRISSETKGGEHFSAYCLCIENIEYTADAVKKSNESTPNAIE